MAFRPSLICGVILFTACSSALKPIRDDETLPVVDTVRDPVVALFDNQAQPHDPAEPITEMQSSETEASSKRSDVNERSVSFLQTRSGSARAGWCYGNDSRCGHIKSGEKVWAGNTHKSTHTMSEDQCLGCRDGCDCRWQAANHSPHGHHRHHRHSGSPAGTPWKTGKCSGDEISDKKGLTLNQCLEYCNGPLTWEDGPNKGNSAPAGSAGCCMWKEKDGGKCYAHLGSGLKEGDSKICTTRRAINQHIPHNHHRHHKHQASPQGSCSYGSPEPTGSSVAYSRTQGYCRGGPNWQDPVHGMELWNCVDNRRSMTQGECQQRCDADPCCAAYDRNDQSMSPCCLFRRGSTGDGAGHRVCFKKTANGRRLLSSGEHSAQVAASTQIYCDSTGPPPPPAKKDKKKKPRSLLIRFKKLLTKKDFDSKKNAILSKLQKLLDISLDRIILALESTGLPAGCDGMKFAACESKAPSASLGKDAFCVYKRCMGDAGCASATAFKTVEAAFKRITHLSSDCQSKTPAQGSACKAIKVSSDQLANLDAAQTCKLLKDAGYPNCDADLSKVSDAQKDAAKKLVEQFKQRAGQCGLSHDYQCGPSDENDCQSELGNAKRNGNVQSAFCGRCRSEGGSQPLRSRCRSCCTECGVATGRRLLSAEPDEHSTQMLLELGNGVESSSLTARVTIQPPLSDNEKDELSADEAAHKLKNMQVKQLSETLGEEVDGTIQDAPTTQSNGGGNSDSGGSSAGVVVGVIFALLIVAAIIVGAVVLQKKREERAHEDRKQKHTAEIDKQSADVKTETEGQA